MRCSAILAAAFVALPIFGQDGRKSDNDVLPGEVWTFEANKGELNRKGEFRIFEKKVFHGETNLGTVSVKGDEATLVVRSGGVLNGRILLKRDGVGWRGIINHNDGSKWSIAVSVKQPKQAKQPPKVRKQKNK